MQSDQSEQDDGDIEVDWQEDKGEAKPASASAEARPIPLKAGIPAELVAKARAISVPGERRLRSARPGSWEGGSRRSGARGGEATKATGPRPRKFGAADAKEISLESVGLQSEDQTNNGDREYKEIQRVVDEPSKPV